MKTLSTALSFCALSGFLIGAAAQAGVTATAVNPACLDHGKPLAVNNAQVVQWKTTTANSFLARGHVTGTVHRVFADHTGHNHFEINLDVSTGDTLEVIYNQEFGALPKLQAGMRVEACGDYITATAASSGGPASPDGAIIHWVHNVSMPPHSGKSGQLAETSKRPSKHDPGYVAVEGEYYGGY